MAKRKLAVDYAELTDEGKILRVTFNRPISRLESDGILYLLAEELRRG